MKIWDWFRRNAVGKPMMEVDTTELRSLMEETQVRELAYWSCVGLIARLIAKCEFQEMRGGQPVRGEEWYAWNVSPNVNQNSSQFLAKLIHKLYGLDNAALVVERNGQLLVADSWSVETRALTDSVFSGVTVDGLTLHGVFPASDVLYFQQSPHNMRVLTDLLYETYGKLIAYSAKTYQASRAHKGVFKMGTEQSNRTTPEETRKQNEVLQSKFAAFLGEKNAVLPLYNGQDYIDMSGNKTYTQETTRDLRAMIDDVMAYDARALGVAPALLMGDVAGIEQAVQYTLASCIDPLADMIGEEINRKRYGKAAVLRGDGIRIDTTSLLHTDLIANAGNIEKLVSSGVFSVNDVLKKLGEPVIPEAWADEHVITKNFATINDYLRGGQADERKTAL